MLHPNARRALSWTLAGITCLIALAVWIPLAKVLRGINPGFVNTFGPILAFGLLGMTFVAPILGLIHGRKGARWVRLAPVRFTGLRRARVAQWVAGIQLVLMTSLVVLAVVVVYAAAKTALRPT